MLSAKHVASLLIGTSLFLRRVMSIGADPVERIILLDVDNTLYDEKIHGIEKQIVSNIHNFCEHKLGLSACEADALHQRYGSTIEGLRNHHWNDISKEELQKNLQEFYDDVYNDVPKKSLLSLHLASHAARTADDSTSNTGYSHNNDLQEQMRQDTLRRLIKASPYAIHLASNSPLFHIKGVVQALGLCDSFKNSFFITPDSSRPKHLEQGNDRVAFPTKLLRKQFFAALLQDLEEDESMKHMTLLDDSPAAMRAGFPHLNGILIVNSKDGDSETQTMSLEEALMQVYGWLDSEYTFSQVEYLKAKNIVDFASINREAWQLIGEEMEIIRKGGTSILRIIDLGAGLLSMLQLVVIGHDDMRSLLEIVGQPSTIHYTAYESNTALLHTCKVNLAMLGFRKVDGTTDGDEELVYEYVSKTKSKVVVYLRHCDYDQVEVDRHENCPHLIIGCCFADLFEPRTLARSLMRSFLSNATSDTDYSIVYFPITFTGTTQFLPSQPFQSEDTSIAIPSDTAFFSAYSEALRERHGHNLDPFLLDEVMASYGARRTFRGPSNWKIDPKENLYLWKTMLFFFASVSALDLQERGLWNVKGWFTRARSEQPDIAVSNVDLVYRVPHMGKWQPSAIGNEPQKISQKPAKYKEIEFTGPLRVQAKNKEARELLPHQVRIQSVASLISSGTELKIFQGSFSDAALDVNIKGMDDETMAYPLSYGYCLVGRVVECGSNVDDEEALIGRNVFAFAPHASQVVVDRSVVQLLPDGLDPYDAIFMPSVETAISLVQDANPRFGENIAVFGQGLIGLLVVSLLKNFNFGVFSGRFGTVSTFDTLPDRLAVSAALGSSQSLYPDKACSAGPFDVAIEVSGNPRALQAAIESTRDGGRILIGSWYGNTPVSLPLDINFHRSHKVLKASQVSCIPSGMQMTWTKDRRFALTWDIVRQLKPSRLLSRISPLEDCQQVYESLNTGKELAVAFVYSQT